MKDNVSEFNKRLIVKDICKGYILSHKSLTDLCKDQNISKHIFYKWAGELGMQEEVEQTSALSKNIRKDAHDMDMHFDVPPEIFRKFMYVAKTYSTDVEKDVLACCTEISLKLKDFYNWLNRYSTILKPIWEAAKSNRREVLTYSTKDMQQDMAQRALETIHEQMKDQIMTEIVTEKGQTTLGGNVIDIDKTTTKKRRQKGSLKAVELALETMGLRNKKIEVTHKYEPIEIVPEESIQSIQSNDEDAIKELEARNKKS